MLMYMYLPTYLPTYMHTNIHTYIHTYTHAYMYPYISMCICMYYIGERLRLAARHRWAQLLVPAHDVYNYIGLL